MNLLCRFIHQGRRTRIGLVLGDQIADLTTAGVRSITALLEAPDPVASLRSHDLDGAPRVPLAEAVLLSPVERQEVWAAGVTYLRSKKARMDESDFSATAYDRVYDAARPEIFFKALAEKVSGPGQSVGIRRDATWNVPEPELALMLNSRGEVAGYTIGNDMSSRDIEGENLLYLPQAKVYDRSCAAGPVVAVGVSEAQARRWKITLEIRRDGKAAFKGATQVSQIKRSFEELAGYLKRSQTFPRGAVLLTGTGVVPGEDFTLQEGDSVRITVGPLGTLENPVAVV